MLLVAGEITGLRNEDISGSRVTIFQSINITSGKNENAARTYTLDSHALKILDDQRQMLLNLYQLSPFVFPAENLGNVRQGTYSEAWKRHCKSKGVLHRQVR